MKRDPTRQLLLRGPARRCARQGGVTLLEMLVTLAIVAMVSALGFQMMAYLARIETHLLAGDAGSNALVVRREWLRHALSGVEAERPDRPGTFKGEARKLSAASSIRPSLPEGGGIFQTEIRFNAQSGYTEVLYSDERTPPVPLMAWPGDGGRFAFLDAAGSEHAEWPPALGVAKALPRAVIIYPRQAELPLVVAIGTSPFVFPTRADVERGL